MLIFDDINKQYAINIFILGTPYFDQFLPLQKALDMSFIDKVYGKDVDRNVTLTIQEFPYPPYKKNSFLTELFLDFLPIFTLLSFIFISPTVLKRVVEEKYTGIKVRYTIT